MADHPIFQYGDLVKFTPAERNCIFVGRVVSYITVERPDDQCIVRIANPDSEGIPFFPPEHSLNLDNPTVLILVPSTDLFACSPKAFGLT